MTAPAYSLLVDEARAARLALEHAIVTGFDVPRMEARARKAREALAEAQPEPPHA